MKKLALFLDTWLILTGFILISRKRYSVVPHEVSTHLKIYINITKIHPVEEFATFNHVYVRKSCTHTYKKRVWSCVEENH